MIEWGSLGAESAKILGAALVGAMLTALYSRYSRVNRLRLAVDIIGQRTVGFDLAQEVLNVKVVLDGKDYTSLHFNALKFENIGHECLEKLELIVWIEGAEEKDWFVKVISSSAKIDSDVNIIDQSPPYVTLEVDSLNPGAEGSIIIISKHSGRLNIASRQKNVILVDRRNQRMRTESVARALLKLASPFGAR